MSHHCLSRLFASVGILLVSNLLTHNCVAQQVETAEAQDEAVIELVEIEVKVVAPDGTPVEGASVKPSAFRTKTDPGSHWMWQADKHGPIPEGVTDENGIVAMHYPKYAREDVEIGEVTWTIEHPDFVRFYDDTRVDEKTAIVQLKEGFRIAASAIDAETGEAIDSNLYAVLAGYTSPKDWSLKDNGFLVSRVFDKKQAFLRLVHFPLEGPALFSELIDVEPPEEGDRVFKRDIKLFPGTRVAGKLDDTVPRPVNGGFVVLNICDGPELNDRLTIWNWTDRTDINEDGTFEFDSVPANCRIQLIAVCDGALSCQPTLEGVQKNFPDEVNSLQSGSRKGQIFKTEGAKIDITLRMEKTGACKVKVFDPNDAPISGAMVSIFPNQYTFRSGSSLLGSGFSARLVFTGEVPDYQVQLKELAQRYQATTDENGIAVIQDLPVKANLYLSASHDEFEVQIEGPLQAIRVNIPEDGNGESTLQMQPKSEDGK